MIKSQAFKSNVLVNEFTIAREDIKKKIIYHFSDVHLAEFDETSSESEKKRAIESQSAWETVRKDFANLHSESCEECQLTSAKEHLKNLISLSKDGDALVMTGDIVDFVSDANLKVIDSVLSGFDKPFISVCGNHEDAKGIPDGFIFSKTKESTQTLDLGDLIIFGIDNSRSSVTKEQNEKLLDVLTLNKPIIIAMHVPVMTDGNKEELIKYDEYFYLNNSRIDGETLKFIEILKNNAEQIIAVFSGHLHFSDESEIAPNLTQFVASQGILGNVNKYVIGV